MPKGIHRYVIKFATNRQLIFHEDRDELYFNAIGHHWDFTIEDASVNVYLPDGARIADVAVWTGHQGSTEGNASREIVADNHASFRLTQPLQPYEGMTVAVTWPKGVIAPPSSMDRLNWFLADHRLGVLSVFGMILILCYYLFAWDKVGRDPKKGSIIARFEPPAGLSPGACQFILDRKPKHEGFAGALVSLAVKGYHTISDGDAEDSYVFKKNMGTYDPLSPAERMLGTYLYALGDRVEMSNKYSSRVESAHRAFTDKLKEEYGAENFRKNKVWAIVGVVLSVLIVFFVAALSGALEDFIPFLVPAAMITFVFGSVGRTIIGRALNGGSKMRQVLNFLPLLVAGGVLLPVGANFFNFFTPNIDHILGLALIAGAVILALLFGYLLEAPTLSGRKLMDEIEGFKHYLKVAEEGQLDHLHPPEKTPELFEKYLPFAIALGAEVQWGEKFADILEAAAKQPGPRRQSQFPLVFGPQFQSVAHVVLRHRPVERHGDGDRQRHHATIAIFRRVFERRRFLRRRRFFRRRWWRWRRR